MVLQGCFGGVMAGWSMDTMKMALGWITVLCLKHHAIVDISEIVDEISIALQYCTCSTCI